MCLLHWGIDDVWKEGGRERDSFCMFCIRDAFSVNWTHFLYKKCIFCFMDAFAVSVMHCLQKGFIFCISDELQMECSEDNALLLLFRAIPVKGNTHQRLVNPVNGHQFGRRLLVWH